MLFNTSFGRTSRRMYHVWQQFGGCFSLHIALNWLGWITPINPKFMVSAVKRPRPIWSIYGLDLFVLVNFFVTDWDPMGFITILHSIWESICLVHFSIRIIAEITTIQVVLTVLIFPTWRHYDSSGANKHPSMFFGKTEEHLPGRPRILPQRHHVFFFSLEGWREWILPGLWIKSL